MFGAGTACIVSPISHIDFVTEKYYIPTMDQPEPVFKMFLNYLTNIQYGHIDHPWSVTIN